MLPLLDLKTHYSIKSAFGTPEAIVETASKLGMTSLAITDYNSVSGCVNFVQACNKYNLKPILGCTFSLKDGGHLIAIAENKEGWNSLIKGVSLANTHEHYNSVHEHPELPLSVLVDTLKSCTLILGSVGDILFKRLFDVENYTEHSEAELLENLKLDPLITLKSIYKELSSKFKVVVGLHLQNNVLSKWFNKVVLDSKLPTVLLSDAHYPTGTDYEYYRILICAKLKTTKGRWEKVAKERDPLLLRFTENSYCIPTKLDDYDVKNQEIADYCEEYNILSDPKLPIFETPNGESPYDYMTQLCREGWKNILVGRNKLNESNKSIYTDRIKHELGVIKDAGLSAYFLIVWDFINYCKKQNWLLGCGRGSAAGCLVSYLLGIIGVDPVEYGLLFSRFYSAARKGTLPDIDTDVPKSKRQQVIDYVRERYGKARVCNMVTFSEMKGASAIKEVLRVNDVCGFEVMNELTKLIPEESKITDELESTGESSILLFTLRHMPDRLKDYARLENDEIVGDFAPWFKQAIAIEGTIQSTGKHASAVVVYEEPLNTVCPMLMDKSGEEPIAGFSMADAEAIGLVKLDILGLATLDKLMVLKDLVKERTGHYKALQCSTLTT